MTGTVSLGRWVAVRLSGPLLLSAGCLLLCMMPGQRLGFQSLENGHLKLLETAQRCRSVQMTVVYMWWNTCSAMTRTNQSLPAPSYKYGATSHSVMFFLEVVRIYDLAFTVLTLSSFVVQEKHGDLRCQFLSYLVFHRCNRVEKLPDAIEAFRPVL